MRRLRKFLVGVVLVLAPVSAVAEMTLLMAEEDGCMWCARWDREVSEIYPKTPEGRAAPLRRIDIRDADQEDFNLLRPLHYTPTFVLLDDGNEIGRIEGYPGEDFFWGLLGMLLKDAPTSSATTG